MKKLSQAAIMSLGLTSSCVVMAADEEVTIRVMQMHENTHQQVMKNIELPVAEKVQTAKQVEVNAGNSENQNQQQTQSIKAENKNTTANSEAQKLQEQEQLREQEMELQYEREREQERTREMLEQREIEELRGAEPERLEMDMNQPDMQQNSHAE